MTLRLGQTEHDPFTWPHTTEHCVYLLSESDETAAVSLWLCLTIYIIAASQHPHRRELKPGITDDITTLLNETTGPCVREGFYSKMGLYNKITVWTNFLRRRSIVS